MIRFAEPVMLGNEKKYMNDAFDSGWISDGKYVSQLESEFCSILGTKNALVTSNGTSALNLAFLALDLQPGDEVIVPGFAFQAAANVVKQLGAVPVFVDVDEHTMLVHLSDIEEKITSKTKIIVIIHSYGYLCDAPAIVRMAIKHNLYIIEDCAEALFSKIGTKYCGTFGDIGTFSFHATKTISTGEGGMVITNNDNLALKMKLIRSHGLAVRGTYTHIMPGNNFRMSNIHAAIGCAQLENYQLIIDSKINMRRQYAKALYDMDYFIRLPLMGVDHKPILWSYPIILNMEYFPDIDTLRKMLSDREIETRPGFTPANLLPYFNNAGNLPNSEKLWMSTLVLPMHLNISTYHIEYICNTLINLRSENGY